MVKRVFKYFVFLFFCSLFMSCSIKKELQIEHDVFCAEKILGKWSRSIVTDTTLNTMENEQIKEIGVVRLRTTSTQNFSKNQEYSIFINQEFISFTPNDDNWDFTKEDIENHFSQTIIITGFYEISRTYLKIVCENVTLNNGKSIPFDEYATINSALGEKIQMSTWTIIDNSIFLTSVKDNISTEFIKTRD